MDVGPHLEHLDEMWKRTTTQYLPYSVRWNEEESILKIRRTILKDRRVEDWEDVLFFKVLGTEIPKFLWAYIGTGSYHFWKRETSTYVTSQSRRLNGRDRRWQKPSLEKSAEQEI